MAAEKSWLSLYYSSDYFKLSNLNIHSTITESIEFEKKPDQDLDLL